MRRRHRAPRLALAALLATAGLVVSSALPASAVTRDFASSCVVAGAPVAATASATWEGPPAEAAPGGAIAVTGVTITAALPLPNLTLNDVHITFSADGGATPPTAEIVIPSVTAPTSATFGPFDLNFTAGPVGSTTTVRLTGFSIGSAVNAGGVTLAQNVTCTNTDWDGVLGTTTVVEAPTNTAAAPQTTAPPTTTTTTTTTVAPAPTAVAVAPRSGLPRTGNATGPLVGFGLAALVVGLTLVGLRRPAPARRGG